MASNLPHQPTTSDSPVPSSSTFDPVWNQVQQSTDLPNDPDVQDAVRSSLEEASRRLANFNPHRASKLSTAAQFQDIESGLVLSLSNNFAPLEDPGADTAVYMGFPPQGPEQKDSEYFHIKHHFDRVFLLHSTNLRLMGNDSKFHQLLGPVSARTERRLRKQGLLDIPEAQRGSKFKYYLDLKPVSEDEEAVILLTDLTCTRGVLNWHLARSKYNLEPHIVLGYDEFGSIPKLQPRNDLARSQEGQKSHQTASAPNRPEECLSDPPTSSRPAPEYSQLRHWSAIERLLNAIEGRNPNLDSAPKVWTFFALAKYFGCAKHERISGWITTWIYRENNENFIQCNPEVAYRIGMGIQSANLVQDAFSILVGERALRVSFKEFNPMTSNDQNNVHRRKPELLDDDEANRIDHAASSLVQRMRDLVHRLCISMDWLTDCLEYAKLSNIVVQTEHDQNTINEAKAMVQDYVRGRIYYVVCQAQSGSDELESRLSDTMAFRSCLDIPFEVVYNSLNQSMRVFTKTLWIALSRTLFNSGFSSTSPDGTTGQPQFTTYTQALVKQYSSDPLNGIKSISRKELDSVVESVNMILLCNRQGGTLGRSKHPDTSISAHVVSPRKVTPVPADFESPSIKHATDVDTQEVQDLTSPQKRRKTLDHAYAKPVPQESEESISTGVSARQALPLRSRLRVGQESGVRHKILSSKEESSSSTRIDWWNLPASNREHPSAHQNTFQPIEPIPDPSISGQPSITSPVDTLQQKSLNTNTDLTPSAAILSPRSKPKEVFPDEYVDTETLLIQVNRHMERLCSKILHPPHLFHNIGFLPTNLFDVLLCLEDNEWRYLPLWAGGNDDGTGGVYDDFPLPIIDDATAQVESFRPGRIRRGFDAPSESEEGSGFEEIASSQGLSTVGRASKNATDGTETVVSLETASDVSDTRFVRLLLDDVSLNGGYEPGHAESPDVSEDGLYTEDDFDGDDDDQDTIAGGFDDQDENDDDSLTTDIEHTAEACTDPVHDHDKGSQDASMEDDFELI